MLVSHLSVTAQDSSCRYDTVTEDFWRLTGAQPALGRLPRPGERGVALLSDSFSRRMIVRQGMRVTIVAIVVGLIGALALSSLMEGCSTASSHGTR
jgi:hypothetical protein